MTSTVVVACSIRKQVIIPHMWSACWCLFLHGRWLNDSPCVPVNGERRRPDGHNQKLRSDGSRVNESDWRFHYQALGAPFCRLRYNAWAQPRPHLLCLHIVTGTGAQAITLTLCLCLIYVRSPSFLIQMLWKWPLAACLRNPKTCHYHLADMCHWPEKREWG